MVLPYDHTPVQGGPRGAARTPTTERLMVETQRALEQHTLADWRRPQYANAWADQDVLRDLLDLPRKMSAALIGHDGSPRAILDIGSGPGAFLEIYLDAYPQARGI